MSDWINQVEEEEIDIKQPKEQKGEREKKMEHEKSKVNEKYPAEDIR